MSAYREIRTEFRVKESLVKALVNLGYEGIMQVEEGKENTLPLAGWLGRQASQNVNVKLKCKGNGGYEDVGFYWNGSSYQAIVSTHDGYGNFGTCSLAKLTQQYSYEEVKRQARLRGYQVQQVNSTDGSIRLVLKRS
jgi:hypothetical protein